MKFSEKWLRELVNPAISTQELVDQITMAGLEVDEVESVANDFSKVIVAKILTAEQHPNADKLQVCTVSDGTEEYQVVCGAPNARAGLITGYAQIGAELFDPTGKSFKIKKAKLRQVESFGMLCADAELGLSEESDGIMELSADAPLGVDLREYLSLDDKIIDVDLTPNRGDCLSISGLAREVGVLNKTAVQYPEFEAAPVTLAERLSIKLEAPSDCPKYLGRIIRNVNVNAKTPPWMVEKLSRSGIRSIDPVVDVTNYVLLELGQPLHAFDLDKLTGGIVVRKAHEGEQLTLLDGNQITVNTDTLVIADDSGAIALAGVFGGEKTGVTSTTTNIFLECAYFNPIAIAGKARNYGLHTDASHRYERGVDWQLQQQGIERATQLLIDIAGGEVAPINDANNEDHLPRLNHITLRHAKVNSMLAFEMPAAEIEEIITRLGITISKKTADTWSLIAPSYRFDITIEVDVIEELARVYGYNNLPVKMPSAALDFTPRSEAQVSIHNIRRTLVARGYQEAITYSFIEKQLQRQFDDKHQGIALANPISAEMAVMRTSIWPALVKTVQYNQNRQQNRVRLFEVGQCFISAGDDILQENVVSGAIVGKRQPDGWSSDNESVDFFDLKGDLEALLNLSGCADEFSFVSDQHTALHPGQTAKVVRNNETVGYIGALHPSLAKEFGINGNLYLFEINQQSLQTGKIVEFNSLSKFPESKRDIAVVVDEQSVFDDLKLIIKRTAGDFLKNVTLFDVYQGQGVEKGRKSLAINLTWQHPSRTLNEEEVNSSIQLVVSALAEQAEAVLRD
ncbi:MAG: phenylalanyl-tRNA synthetase beta chain [Oceanospirillaceae bacterium]|jgi:phenylalanyl-tRNA synthetase beta chain